MPVRGDSPPPPDPALASTETAASPSCEVDASRVAGVPSRSADVS
jgi:hypothetical protein